MAKEPVTQNRPVAKPAPTANPSSGFGPRNAAKQSAPSSAQTKALPKTTAMLALFAFSSVTPEASIQRFANKAGEYQAPPSKNAETAAAIAANQLIDDKSIHFLPECAGLAGCCFPFFLFIRVSK